LAVIHAVVGDVHGHLDGLLRLEEVLARHAAREGAELRVVCVGDLLDRGPASAQVVRHLRERVAAGTHAAVLGNHEAMFLGVLDAVAPHLVRGIGLPDDTPSLATTWARQQGGASRMLPRLAYLQYQTLMWLVQGGAATLKSYDADNDPATPERWRVDWDDLRFLRGLPVVWRGPGVVVTHALVDAAVLDALGAPEPLTRERARESALWSRRVPKERPDPARVHVSGHTPMRKVRRRPSLGVVQVDTGAAFAHRLSAWCVETDRIFSVPLS
jgi:serine/threonine protein phosphatase 1